MCFCRNTASCFSLILEISSPLIFTVPRVGFSSPASWFSRVDLPLPEVPSIQHTCPCSMVRSILSRATTFSSPVRYTLRRFLVSTMYCTFFPPLAEKSYFTKISVQFDGFYCIQKQKMQKNFAANCTTGANTVSIPFCPYIVNAVHGEFIKY